MIVQRFLEFLKGDMTMQEKTLVLIKPDAFE